MIRLLEYMTQTPCGHNWWLTKRTWCLKYWFENLCWILKMISMINVWKSKCKLRHFKFWKWNVKIWLRLQGACIKTWISSEINRLSRNHPIYSYRTSNCRNNIREWEPSGLDGSNANAGSVTSAENPKLNNDSEFPIDELLLLVGWLIY